eukprot:TRINITY_DN3267_c0_g1_i4.p1 TRINITY_DN3267_c0_g1~~TRINITY_DN3267_c0_g1_i4.p1  ORF type:complete len:1474 (-),score=457.33 TRINITY_DN3267_c0_g1_i4:80-4501(-)
MTLGGEQVSAAAAAEAIQPSNNKLVVFDTTLRDGEQSPGVSLSAQDKVIIAKQLSLLGVDVCEIGFPACAVDLASIQQIVREVGSSTEGRERCGGRPMSLAVLARCVKNDIDAAWDVVKYATCPRIHVFYGTSDLHLQHKLKKTKVEALEAIAKHVAYARSLCPDVEFSAEDAVRTDFDFLLQVVQTAIQAGATTVNIPDTVGYSLPSEYGQLIGALIQNVGERAENVIFSTHCHNDLGLATANTLAGVRAGARQVEVTVNGIGERAGNTAMEEVVMAIHTHPLQFDGLSLSIRPELFVPTSLIVEKLSGMKIQKNKAIVGQNAFLHESGVHVDGFLKHRETYEIMHPSTVGWDTDGIVLGKHSGRSAYRSVMSKWGYEFKSEEQFSKSFGKFQELVTQKKNVTEDEIKKTGLIDFIQKELPPNEFLVTELIGDGVSEEVSSEGKKMLNLVSQLTNKTVHVQQHYIGGKSIDAYGVPLTDEAIAACKSSSAVLLGAVGDPRFDSPNIKIRPEQGLLKIRSEMGLFQNVRPVSVPESLTAASPLKDHLILNTDFVILRELTGGIYNHSHEIDEENAEARDIMLYRDFEIERIARAAGALARLRRKKVTSIHKANVLACSQYWKRITTKIFEEEFPDVTLEHQLVDSAAIHLLKRPSDFDVILTPNLFGDILSDEAAALTCSLGMLPSASLSYDGKPGLYEPVHGSAPDIAGRGIANPVGTILSVALMLRLSFKMDQEATALENAVQKTIDEGIVTADIAKKGQKSYATSEVGDRVAFHFKTALEALSAQSRPMNLTEKILCHQALGLKTASVKPGDIVVVKVARTLASEMTWVSMSSTYAHLGKPKLWRKDRFWLAIDHTVDPRNINDPKRQEYIKTCKTFADEVNLDDFLGPNQSILHTEFYRQRAVPGTVIIGADSHSCSAGCLGAFATGMGAADVLMPVLTGQTWIKVPETILIDLQGELAPGMTGKDVMLWILKELKRNSVALERSVEFTGNVKALSVDARFAIANMITEFGGIAGIFPSDEITAAFLSKRQTELDAEARNFRADENAEYAGKYVINLSEIVPSIAVFPEPDNVITIDSPLIDEPLEEAGKSIRNLDGCFIGACTTTEEELILAAMVLKKGLENGLQPIPQGVRRVTPGSVQIVDKLERLGLADVYRRAGFTIGAPGCSYCLGVGADVAASGEIWLSSQNRNFRNRMGKGSFGNLASAATVAISSFNMVISDPRDILNQLDYAEFNSYLEMPALPAEVPIHDPLPEMDAAPAIVPSGEGEERKSAVEFSVIEGKVQAFGDSVDTDAIIPGPYMLVRPLKKLGEHAFQFVKSDFVTKVAEGYNIVVGGVGFGSGSSREEAVLALVGCGVRAVIAKSFSFIFGRNLLCLNLLGITVEDDEFYQLASEGQTVSIDVNKGIVCVGEKTFAFSLSEIQKEIYRNGGIIEMYKNQGASVFKELAAHARKRELEASGCGGSCGSESW